MSKFTNSVLGVTGASGHLGRLTIEHLLKSGATHIVAITRDPAKLADLSARGVDVRQGSFDEPASLVAAFKNIERLLIISTDSLGVEGGRKAQHIRAIDAAEKAGVGHILYTSLTNPYPNPEALIPDDHFWTEARLAAGNFDWSVLRNNLYVDGFLESGKQAITGGKLYHASGTTGRSYVTRADCAAAAAGALLTAEGRNIFDITGPAAVTQGEIAALLTSIAGKPVAAESLPPEAFRSGLAAAGLPAIYANLIARFDSDAAQGYYEIVTDAVRRLTGQPAQSVATFLAANTTALRG